ncbi:MAG: ATP synthase subunit C [Candidatus Latescibacterota bacterium]
MMPFRRAVVSIKTANAGLGVLSLILLVGGLLLICNFGFTGAADAQTGATQTADHGGRGLGFIAAAVAVGMSTIGAGIAVSIVGSAAMGAVAERPELMGRSIIYVGLAEGIAIYGLIIGIMILGKI